MKKRIIHFSFDDFTGAGLAAYRFHKNLLDYNFDSTMIVNNSKNKSSKIIKLNIKNKINQVLNKIEFFGLNSNNKYAFYNKNRYLINNIEQLEFILKLNPEIIIFHWITNFINPVLFSKIQLIYNCKIFWNLIDIAPLTGGCHINWDCNEFHDKCKNCPATKIILNSRARNTLEQKKNELRKIDMNFLYTCDWMGYQLEKSSIFCENHKKFKLMIPVDETIFSPKKYIKENLKKFKCENKINFFFRSSYNKRKGITELIKILHKLIDLRKDFRKQIRLISIGDSFFQKKSNNLDIEYHNLGTIINENDLAEIYNISDLFISPSLEDVGPMMINEAIISGVPVISFDIGVAKDLIVENINGYIVKKDDYKMFANKLSMFLNLSKNKLSEMKKKSREIGLINTSNKTHIDEFKKIIIN